MPRLGRLFPLGQPGPQPGESSFTSGSIERAGYLLTAETEPGHACLVVVADVY
jgi:hypothetical protein